MGAVHRDVGKRGAGQPEITILSNCANEFLVGPVPTFAQFRNGRFFFLTHRFGARNTDKISNHKKTRGEERCSFLLCAF
jgi:hypothetical protein